jgi:hypothetical protein
LLLSTEIGPSSLINLKRRSIKLINSESSFLSPKINFQAFKSLISLYQQTQFTTPRTMRNSIQSSRNTWTIQEFVLFAAKNFILEWEAGLLSSLSLSRQKTTSQSK